MAHYPAHQAVMYGEGLGTGVEPCDSGTLSGTSAEEERRRRCGHGQSQTLSTVQGADLTVRATLTILDRQIAAELWRSTCTPQPARHRVTIAGCSARWNPRADARRYKQVLSDRRVSILRRSLTHSVISTCRGVQHAVPPSSSRPSRALSCSTGQCRTRALLDRA
jgi:hypothetical protein